MRPRSTRTHRLALSALLVAGIAVTAVVLAITGEDAATPDAAAGRGTAVATSAIDPAVRLSPRAVSAPVDSSSHADVSIDTRHPRQAWWGIGGALTDASVDHLDGEEELIRLLLDPRSERGTRLEWLRLPLTATDFSTSDWGWSFDGRSAVPSPQAERVLAFVRDQVLPVAPDLRLVATPWSAPPELKTEPTWHGGALRGDAAETYAEMLVAQARYLREHGFPLEAMTLANEPGLASDYPTMQVTDAQLARLAELTGPGLDELGVDLWGLDDNWSQRDRADRLLHGDPGRYDAVGFHCYDGSPQSTVALAAPSVVTECTGTSADAAETFAWDAELLVDASLDAGSSGLLMWNLVLSPGWHGAFGGCHTCRGLLTRTGDDHHAEPEFYVLAHLRRAAGEDARVLPVSAPGELDVVAFAHGDGSLGAFVHNRSSTEEDVQVVVDGDTIGRVVVGPSELVTWTTSAPP